MKIKKGDNVKMLSGKDRNKTGKILSVHFDDNRVVVEGLNIMKKHTRARQQGQKGQIISKERAVNASSVALICKSCGKVTRVGYKLIGDSKIRICKKCGGEV
jgi:large subunit ribosomal protein L24